MNPTLTPLEGTSRHHTASSTVCLRAMEPEDLELLYQVENDQSLWDKGVTNVPYSHFLLREFIANSTGDIYTDKQVRLMISTPDTTVGIADLINFDPSHQRAEVGIVVLAQYRRQGFALEALRQLALYARQTLHLHQLYAYVDMQNDSSLNLFKKAGFHHTCTLQDWLFDGKNHHDAAFLQLFL